MEKDSGSRGVLPKHLPCSPDSLHGTQKDPDTRARLGLAAASPPLAFGEP